MVRAASAVVVALAVCGVVALFASASAAGAAGAGVRTRNLATIAAHNHAASAGKVSYTLGPNRFWDLTAKQFEARYIAAPGGFSVVPALSAPAGHGAATAQGKIDAASLPTSVDWRTTGDVPPVAVSVTRICTHPRAHPRCVFIVWWW